jgi:Tol biopolymer transport system component
MTPGQLSMRPHRTRLAAALLIGLTSVLLATPARAQYFGQNKVHRHAFAFQVLATPHFNIYYYPSEREAARQAGRLAERWYTRFSTLFEHKLTGKQTIVFYASHPDFEQTNVIEGVPGEGTGGVTEALERRIVLPAGASLRDTDHVIGHELVHAFQYDMLGRVAGNMPLWFMEGMAEYLSLGPDDPQTAMWLRDAAIDNDLPTVSDLDNAKYFPYRFGQAFWAYLGGRWGDGIIRTVMQDVVGVRRSASTSGTRPGKPPGTPAGARSGTRTNQRPAAQASVAGDPIAAIEAATHVDRKTLSAEWHAAIRRTYDLAKGSHPAVWSGPGIRTLIPSTREGGRVNVGPALSPNGGQVAFLSERNQLSINLYLANVASRHVTRTLISTAADPHFDSLQFLASAGAWDPGGRRLAVATLRAGHPVIAIVDAATGHITTEVPFATLGEIFQPAWSPDGSSIAFSAQVGGFTDLYVYNLHTRKLERLTHDTYADLQPSWTPDGHALTFVTDQFSTSLDTLEAGRYELAQIDLADRAIHQIRTGLSGSAYTPAWSADGRQLYFVSTYSGRPEVYRLDEATGRTVRLTDALTGIAGITPTSPALSLAAHADRMAVTVFDHRGYDIDVVDPAELPVRPPGEPTGTEGVLPPVKRSTNLVATFLQQPTKGLSNARAFSSHPLGSSLSLVAVTPEAGFTTSTTFGSYVSGGISFLFSDVLGNHELATTFAVNGSFADTAVGADYVNRAHRWNWGVFGDRIPILTGYVSAAAGVAGGVPVYLQQISRFRQTYTEAGISTAYPFSRATRVELTASFDNIGFSQAVETDGFALDTGQLLFTNTQNLPGGPSIRLFSTGAALIRDTAVFGATGPVLGERLHLEVGRSVGGLSMTNVIADVREYVMPMRPITLAGRLLHVARYGRDADTPRLTPLYLGYPTLVRGYDVNSFQSNECPPTGPCTLFDNLFGSRLLVANGEIRAPLVGLFTGQLHYGPVPVDVFGFGDAGVAWTAQDKPAFLGGSRPWVASAGIGLRANLFGFAVGEIDLIHPFERPNRGWLWAFNLSPAF